MAATATAAREKAAAAGDADALNRLRSRRPAERSVWLQVDDAVQSELDEAIADERTAKFTLSEDDPRRAAAIERVAAARVAVRADAVGVVLRNQGRRAYRALLDAHPPRDEDHQRAQRQTGNASARAEFNVETFPIALIAFAVAEPAGLTESELTDLIDDGRVSEGEADQLFTAALQVHQGSRVADLGK
ncbi:hypothetical protein [Frankia sp. AvcI1]|uniref:hypothetical protein n=1 Tax=Frankia sp. AvcI1 TaxID=573496 RepID=UPI002117F8CC|nr:hypothetical protein [Frankia sp. AvcI1]